MESTISALRSTPTKVIAGTAALAALTAAGCGSSGGSYKNADRPPTPIVISASIGQSSVTVSPRRFGAGPITLVITNQSQKAQQVTLETADRPGSGPGEKAVQTGPISPRETASVRAVVRQGTYDLHVGGSGVRAAHLVVGHERKSSQNDVLQP